MNKEDKSAVISGLSEQLEAYSHFYLADIANLNAAVTSDLRRACFKSEIKLIVVKNTLLKRALETSEVNFEEIYPSLSGSTSIMFCNTGNAPAKLIKDFGKKHSKPVLKAAYVEESIYVGEDQLEALVNVKSREELIGDIISLLQSPAKNVISGLQSGGSILHGVLKTLGERES